MNIEIPIDFHDDNFCKIFGKYQKSILIDAEEFDNIEINFSQTEWASPFALLGCLCFLGECYRIKGKDVYKDNFIINLGKSEQAPVKPSNRGHNVFLKFLLEEGFLDRFIEFSIIKLNGNKYALDKISLKNSLSIEGVDELRTELTANIVGVSSVFGARDVIKASLVRVGDYIRGNHPVEAEIQRFVEKIVGEAGSRAIEEHYTKRPHLRDHYFQKFRIVIRELLSNAIEHAYLGDRIYSGYVGVYARLRKHGKSRISERLKNEKEFSIMLKNEMNSGAYPKLAEFEQPAGHEWIEFFVCDLGLGLSSPENARSWLANIEDRTSNGRQAEIESDVVKILRKIISGESKNPLLLLKQKLFSFDFSKFTPKQRSDQSRSEMTGLQHVAYVLGREKDYLRIHANGEWIGAHFPWQRDETGKHKKVEHNMLGTFIHCCMPDKYQVSYGENWSTIENTLLRQSLESALNKGQGVSKHELAKSLTLSPPERANNLKQYISEKYKGIFFLDRRGENLPIDLSELVRIKNTFESNGVCHLIFRPSRAMSKNEIHTFLEFFCGKKRDQDNRLAPGMPGYELQTLVFAELSPYQGLVFFDLIRRILLSLSNEKRPRLILQTEDWAFAFPDESIY